VDKLDDFNTAMSEIATPDKKNDLRNGIGFKNTID